MTEFEKQKQHVLDKLNQYAPTELSYHIYTELFDLISALEPDQSEGENNERTI